ncbi:alpha/beta hydrolase [Pseudoflavitalea sp. X16]|uniref:alpha/beta hydrolase n=1 Tax=Paraflavitalea devenefica TaxID=2716334 RepID=UPI0014234DB2|nr:alpha/beta hydrolase [Paraflavitalea devenefica]NII29691.1 alpha/beta hydrolase [Paraflavitalea devenefica]
MKKVFYTLLSLIPVFLISCDKTENDGASTSLTDLQNIQYGVAPDSGGVQTQLLLDIYFPPVATTAHKYPLVLFTHGGGFIQGDKADTKTICSALADSGFVVASINYRLGWRTGTSSCSGDTLNKRLAAYRAIQDANAALRFLVSKAGEYAIDENYVFIGGGSAGAGTSLMTTYITNPVAQQIAAQEYVALGPVNTSGNLLTTAFVIKGIVNMWGALPDSTLITSSAAVPMISFHGTSDNVVPYDFGYSNNCPNYQMEYGSACLSRRLYAANKPFWLRLKTGGGHGPDLYAPGFTVPKIADFFRKIIKGENIESKVWVD